jgi:hypothetical protein
MIRSERAIITISFTVSDSYRTAVQTVTAREMTSV